jgi:hypothetical protein
MHRPSPTQAILEISFAKESLIIHWKIGRGGFEELVKTSQVDLVESKVLTC